MVSYCKMKQMQYQTRHSDIETITKTKNHRHRVKSNLVLLRRKRVNHKFHSKACRFK